MKLYDWKEFVYEAKDVDLESFELRDSLHPKFWKDEKLDFEVKNGYFVFIIPICSF